MKYDWSTNEITVQQQSKTKYTKTKSDFRLLGSVNDTKHQIKRHNSKQLHVCKQKQKQQRNPQHCNNYRKNLSLLFPSSRKIEQRKFDRSHDHSKIKHAREKFKISMDPGKWDNHEGKIVIKTINIRDSDYFLC